MFTGPMESISIRNRFAKVAMFNLLTCLLHSGQVSFIYQYQGSLDFAPCLVLAHARALQAGFRIRGSLLRNPGVRVHSDERSVGMRAKHDTVVIGAGLAGLRAAVECAEKTRVAVLSKVYPTRSHSGAARGGIDGDGKKKDPWHFFSGIPSG